MGEGRRGSEPFWKLRPTQFPLATPRIAQNHTYVGRGAESGDPARLLRHWKGGRHLLVLTVCVIQLPAYARDGHKKPREGAMPRPIWGGTIKRIRNRTVSFCLASLILTISPAWGGDKEKDEETL